VHYLCIPACRTLLTQASLGAIAAVVRDMSLPLKAMSSRGCLPSHLLLHAQLLALPAEALLQVGHQEQTVEAAEPGTADDLASAASVAAGVVVHTAAASGVAVEGAAGGAATA